ncbi:MAG: hypothetical protein NVS2B9_14100 [Myxococcales bacterium]
MGRCRPAACLVAAALLAAPAARADRRSFIRAYEYATQPEGNLEFELWNEIEAPRGGPFADALVTHRFELEYGLTDHWDVALYHVLQHGGGGAPRDGALRFDSWRTESRYRLAEKGEWPVDVMLYGEVERPADFSAPWEIEEKLILGRDFGAIGLVANLVFEQALATGARAHHLFELDLGARYEFSPAVRLGAEFWAIRAFAAGQPAANSYFLGPSLSLSGQRVWIQLGAGVGLGSTAESLFARSVLGFNL